MITGVNFQAGAVRPAAEEDFMDPKDVEFFRELLNGMLQDILKKGEETIEDMTDTVEVYADPADRATAESDRAFTLRLRDRERRLIKKIKEAIERIDEGTYGECVECGEDISVARMKARPVTTLCIKCKSRQEADEDLRGD
ncbi:putative DnaK suppressor protein [Solidesulfovibrio magneticus RS-1]|uniref:RNA polymerase-binding transcription factor DksA n=3 Tax=Solidesulfovibrio TaxID=2910984 RepID=C4XHJ9_SOLM1|nr:putative DnaK suppressor protein [Solidesulfovibrio magneticus RS-1]